MTYRRFRGVPRVGADRSAWGSCLLWGRFIGVHLYFVGVLLVIPILIGGISIIARAVTLVLQFLNPLLYRNIPLLTVSILERVAGRG